MIECDLNAERSLQLCGATDGDTACYRVLYQEEEEEEEASIQLPLDCFLKKVDNQLPLRTQLRM